MVSLGRAGLSFPSRHLPSLHGYLHTIGLVLPYPMCVGVLGLSACSGHRGHPPDAAVPSSVPGEGRDVPPCRCCGTAPWHRSPSLLYDTSQGIPIQLKEPFALWSLRERL